MQTKQIALVALLAFILLPVQSVFVSRVLTRTSSVQPFNSFHAAPIVVTATPLPAETPAAPPLSLTIMLGFTCLALLLIIGVIVIGFLTGITNRREAGKKSRR
jgi:hypothetical protein